MIPGLRGLSFAACFHDKARFELRIDGAGVIWMDKG